MRSREYHELTNAILLSAFLNSNANDGGSIICRQFKNDDAFVFP